MQLKKKNLQIEKEQKKNKDWYLNIPKQGDCPEILNVRR